MSASLKLKPATQGFAHNGAQEVGCDPEWLAVLPSGAHRSGPDSANSLEVARPKGTTWNLAAVCEALLEKRANPIVDTRIDHQMDAGRSAPRFFTRLRKIDVDVVATGFLQPQSLAADVEFDSRISPR